MSVVAVLAGHLTRGLQAQAASPVLYSASSFVGAPDGGSAAGQMWYPTGVAVGPQDRIYVADSLNNRVQIFNADGTFHAQFGSEGSGPGEFQYPAGIAVDSQGNILVVDSDNHRLQLFNANRAFVRSFGTYGNFDPLVPDENTGPRTLEGMAYPTGVAILPGATLDVDVSDDPLATAPPGPFRVAVVDTFNHRIIRLDAALKPVSEFGTHGVDGNQLGELEYPWGIGMDASRIYVTDPENHRVQVYSLTGQIQFAFGSTGAFHAPDGLDRPYAVRPAENGRLVVVDYQRNNALSMTPVAVADPTLPLCSDVAATADRGLCTIVATNNTIYEAQVLGGFAPNGNDEGKFSHPHSVAIDSTGRLLVANTDGHRIVVLLPARLSVSSVNITPGPIPVEVRAGQPVSLAVTIANEGIDGFTVAPQVSFTHTRPDLTTITGTLPVPDGAWLPGGTSSLPFTVPFVPTLSGTVTFSVIAKGQPASLNLKPIASPAVAAGPVKVLPAAAPSLAVAIAGPTQVGIGPVQLPVTVTNSGSVALTTAVPLVDVIHTTPAGVASPVTTIAAVPNQTITGALAGDTSRAYTVTYNAAALGTATFTPRASATCVDTSLAGCAGTIQAPAGTAKSVVIVADNDKPTTTYSIAPAIDPVTQWYRDQVTVTLRATDPSDPVGNPGGNVAFIHYEVVAVQGPGPTDAPGAAATIPLVYDGGTVLKFYAVDKAGNREAPKTVTINIDATLPQISQAAALPTDPVAINGWFNKPAIIRFNAGDGGSGLRSFTGPVTVSTNGENQPVIGTAFDNAGNQNTTTVTVSVDTVKPAFTCNAGAPTVWPPNHKMVEWKPAISVSDPTSGLGGKTFKLVDFYSSEPANGKGDGNTELDMSGWELDKPDTVGSVRVERSGNGIGRTYTLVYMATDVAGNTAQCSVSLTVPHDQGKKK